MTFIPESLQKMYNASSQDDLKFILSYLYAVRAFRIASCDTPAHLHPAFLSDVLTILFIVVALFIAHDELQNSGKVSAFIDGEFLNSNGLLHVLHLTLASSQEVMS